MFTGAIKCFYILHKSIRQLSDSTHFRPEDTRRAQWSAAAHTAAFFSGWLLFPIGYTLGPLFMGTISLES